MWGFLWLFFYYLLRIRNNNPSDVNKDYGKTMPCLCVDLIVIRQKHDFSFDKENCC